MAAVIRHKRRNTINNNNNNKIYKPIPRVNILSEKLCELSKNNTNITFIPN